MEKARYFIVSCFFITVFQKNKTTIMGRGDAKTKKGKIFKGSFGKTRPAKVVKKNAPKKKA
jgi:30S ribosomal protein S31